MFSGDSNPNISKIMDTLASHKETKAHDRHLSADKCKEMGLNVTFLEEEDKLQIMYCLFIIVQWRYLNN